MDRINDEQFIPNVQDVLMTRVPTLGVHEIHFNLKGLDFRYKNNDPSICGGLLNGLNENFGYSAPLNDTVTLLHNKQLPALYRAYDSNAVKKAIFLRFQRLLSSLLIYIYGSLYPYKCA